MPPFYKRRLDVNDDAALQGWDSKSRRNYLGIGRFYPHCLQRWDSKARSHHSAVLPSSPLSTTQLLEALGNGFSVNVFEALFKQMLMCYAKQ